ncbi:MAG: hypothetical protein GY870_19615 [archaeon]|nr:hypothetical protein [archaeon]
MNTFAIIVNDKIVYASNVAEEPMFEVAIFTNALFKLLSKNTWKLHKIILQPLAGFHKEKILVHQVYYKEYDLDVLYCEKGQFTNGTSISYKALQKFQDDVENMYPPETFLDMIESKQVIFQEACENITFNIIQSNGKLHSKDKKKSNEKMNGKPLLLYTGVSTQGLPIVSKVFDPRVIIGNTEMTGEEFEKSIHLMENTISGQLATISINSFIRAKSYVEEIQILMDEEKQLYGFINFGQVGTNRIYTLEIFTMGQSSASNVFFKRIKNTSENFECLQNPFAGELKPYSELKDFLSSLTLGPNSDINWFF